MNNTDSFLAVVNPAAGGGRCRKLVSKALDRLRAGGIKLDVAETSGPGEGVNLARDGYARGYRKFIAVGGDGTSYEIVTFCPNITCPTSMVTVLAALTASAS